MCVSPSEDGHILAGMDVSLANDRYLGPPWEGAALAILKRSDGGQEGMTFRGHRDCLCPQHHVQGRPLAWPLALVTYSRGPSFLLVGRDAPDPRALCPLELLAPARRCGSCFKSELTLLSSDWGNAVGLRLQNPSWTEQRPGKTQMWEESKCPCQSHRLAPSVYPKPPEYPPWVLTTTGGGSFPWSSMAPRAS